VAACRTRTWKATVARSVFERLEALGFRDLKLHLTEEARAHAFAAAVPAQFTASLGYGRGERSRGFAFQLIYTIAPAASMLVEWRPDLAARQSRMVGKQAI
jgi:hypothetical protein